MTSGNSSPVVRSLMRRVKRSSPALSCASQAGFVADARRPPREKKGLPSASRSSVEQYLFALDDHAGLDGRGVQSAAMSPVSVAATRQWIEYWVAFGGPAKHDQPLAQAREIRFHGAFLDFLEDRLAQGFLVGRDGLGVGIFGAQVLQDLGALLFTQPLVVVDKGVTVVGGGDALALVAGSSARCFMLLFNPKRGPSARW